MMEKKPVLTDWLYEWDCPQNVLNIAVKHAQNATYYDGVKNQTSYPEQFFDDDFDPVRNWVDARLHEIKLDLDLECEHLKSTVFWTTKSERGQWHHTHKHGFSVVSGIIYLTPSGSQTWFSRDSVWSNDYTSVAIHNSEKSTLLFKRQTEVGKAIFFPSGVHHSVTQHDRTEPRHTLSFNSFVSGQIGSYSDIHSRRLLNLTVNQKE
jgi:hypothetical protein